MLPLTIVTGFLGAGKTTLVNHILSSARDRRIGVLVNDFGEINIDSQLIVGSAEGVVSLQNGCICCSIKGDLVSALMKVLEHQTPPEHILVEASGVSSPGPLAEVFLGLQKQGVLRVDGIVVVVDAERFPFDDLKGQPLARDQVLASDLVVLNKADLVDEARLVAIEGAVRKRVAEARIVRAVEGKVDVDVLLGIAHVHDDEQVHAHAHAHAHEHEHGFASWVYQAEGSLDFKRLVEEIKALPAGILRIKGVIAVRERPGDRLALNVVGKRVHIQTLEPFPGPPHSQLLIIGERDAVVPLLLAAALERCRSQQ